METKIERNINLKEGIMVSVKVENSDGITGCVDVESWANPKTQILDLCLENGETKPEYKNALKYLGIEEY